MLGGPNGAGKTTAAQVLVPKSYGVREFVNADEIARGLSPFNPDGVALAAGRLMLRRIDELVFHGESFAFETTCAGRGHALWLKKAQAEGWRVSLLYLWLDSPDLARARVSQRVQEGGHDIPPAVIDRRWRAGAKNLVNLYLPLADRVGVFNNSEGRLTLIAERVGTNPLQVLDSKTWSMIDSLAHEDDR